MRRTTIFITAAIALAGTASPAMADGTRTQNVGFGDLTLTDASDVALLKARLRDAAEDVCRDAGWAERQCVKATYSAALSDLEARVPTAVALTD